MSQPFAQRFASFTMAALVTVGLLGSMNLIAAEQVSAARMAHAQSHGETPMAARALCPAQS